MIKSHITAPATYLKNFRIQKGRFPSNGDQLYVFDKLRKEYHFDWNTRGKWVQEWGFFNENIEAYNSSFESKYPRQYKKIIDSFRFGIEIEPNIRSGMLEFLMNMRARNISDNMPPDVRADPEKRNAIVPPFTETLIRGYQNEIIFIQISDGFVITSDSPLLSVTPVAMISKNAFIRVLPIDFSHLILLKQYREIRDAAGLDQTIAKWRENQAQITFWLNCEAILAAKRYVVFREKSELDMYLQHEYIRSRLE
jgi:hypothetical protein